MKKNKKKEMEDRYYLLTIILTEISCFCYIMTYLSFPIVLNILLYSLMILLELFFLRKISMENDINKSLLSFSISSLSIILIDMIIVTFSNNILSFIKIGKYFVLYLLFSLLILLNYKYNTKRKILTDMISISICIIYLVIFITLVLK